MNRTLQIILLSLFLLGLLGMYADSALAETPARPTVIVAPAASIRSSKITLGEIAQIDSASSEHAAQVQKLKAIVLGDAPAPMLKTTLQAAAILAKIEESGIAQEAIGFSIPNAVTVEREGRKVNTEEVLAAAHESVKADTSLDVHVREVSWTADQVIPAGPSAITVERLGLPRGGKLPIRVEVTVSGEPATRFLATALVDDWRDIPVVEKTLERGQLISPSDIQLVRLNLYKQPEDIVDSLDEVIGRRVLATIPAGETIRKKMVEIPPLITKGKRVTMSYNIGGFFATATGTALEDGLDGSSIRIKNESSGKIIRAKVISPDEVEVLAR